MFRKRHRQVRIFVHDGPTLEGLLVRRGREYVLWDGKLIAAEGNTSLSGHTCVPRERVLYFQDLTGVAE